MKYIFAVFLIVIGIVQLFSGLAGLPEGIALFRQGNMAGSGAASGGLLFGPLFIYGGARLWGSARKESAAVTDVTTSAEQVAHEEPDRSQEVDSDSKSP